MRELIQTIIRLISFSQNLRRHDTLGAFLLSFTRETIFAISCFLFRAASLFCREARYFMLDDVFIANNIIFLYHFTHKRNMRNEPLPL